MENPKQDLIPEKNRPPETPLTSLGHELGIMFGFMAACVLIMVIYVVFWRVAEKHEEAHQAKRRERLAAQYAHGHLARGGLGGVHEKMVDGEGEISAEGAGAASASVERRVELPGSGTFDIVYPRGGVKDTHAHAHAREGYGNGGGNGSGQRFEFEFGFRGE